MSSPVLLFYGGYSICVPLSPKYFYGLSHGCRLVLLRSMRILGPYMQVPSIDFRARG